MKSRLSYLVFFILAAAFSVYVWQTRHQLPIRTATHFNWEGRGDGWSSRDAHIQTTLLAGLGLPFLIVIVFSSLRFFPSSVINLPHKEHWLNAENRTSTLQWIAGSGAWLASALVVFMGVLHYFILKANAVKPPHLDSRGLLIAAVLLTLFELGFILRLFLRFAKPPVTK